MRTKFLLLTCATLFLQSACNTPPHPVSFCGSYTGAEVHESNRFAKSLVEALVVTGQAGSYSLAGDMNDTNREPGMDHASNTRWQWAGSGTVQNGSLEFTYSSTLGQRGTGTMRSERTGLLLTLDHNQYQLRQSPP